MVAVVPPVPQLHTIHRGNGVRLALHLGEDRLGDVVVASPVGGALGVGELVHVVAAPLAGQPPRLSVDVVRVVDEMAMAAVELDGRDLLRRSGRRHHRDERQSEEAREIGLRHRRGSRRRFDHRAASVKPAVAYRIEEERAGEPVLEAPRGMAGLVLEVEVHAGVGRQRHGDQVRVGGAIEVRLDSADGLPAPASIARVRQDIPRWPLPQITASGSRAANAATAVRARQGCGRGGAAPRPARAWPAPGRPGRKARRRAGPRKRRLAARWRSGCRRGSGAAPPPPADRAGGTSAVPTLIMKPTWLARRTAIAKAKNATMKSASNASTFTIQSSGDTDP